jgi:hypothetical protein
MVELFMILDVTFTQRAFLPTMPQDDVAEIKEALLAARRGGDENPVFYRKLKAV